MAAYKPTMSYRLIYIFTIHDAQHEGYWKIGKTNFDSVNSYKQLPPNCAELNCAARDRIDQYTKTAMVEYDLQYTELARRTVTFPDGTTDTELFDDDDVHNVLYNSGFSARKFSNSNQDSEWFEVPLSVAIRAIQAVKEGRTALTAAEKSEGQISFLPQAVPAAPKKRAITLRDEQMDCVNQTLRVFRKENSMLWNCKMRFGKTVTAYALIKKAGYQKVIVVTHRPVVEDGWRNDFDLIFGEGDNRAFLKKDRFDTDSSVYDAAMDARNDANLTAYQNSGKAFVYFASMQDLRGSQRADGKFDKNNAVFDMDWDLVIYDEAHEGTQTQQGQKVQSLLEAEKNGKAPKVLQLSGTPYNLMQKYENNVYTWDYVMEQKRKREWDTLHPGDHNPYADLPELRILTFDLGKSLPTSYRYETLEMAFNFTEFFRVWTGYPARDFHPLPAGAQVGDFVHEADVRSFLDLISSENPESNYPYSTPEYREMFRHTLWMVPGVKEASALSRMLKDHPVFGAYKVANVAGDGDAEMPYDNALTLVKQVIKANRYTITISCGKLTTGVTVPEWTAVMMLTGSASTAASGYMQTIFRVQSAGVLDGKQKERCYVFDFAPDRALNVISEVNRITKRGRTNEEQNRAALGEFLNFCPVIAVDGTQMTAYSVSRMMRQIKRLTVDRAIKSGFDDESVYKQDTGIVMDEDDVQLFHTLSDKLSEQKAAKKETKVHINHQGLTGEEYEKADKISNKPKRERTKEDDDLLKKLQEQKKEREKVIRLLRNVSIRLPLLIYGAKVDLTESIKMADFITLVDEESWQEFMPKTVDKPLFRKLLKYYDEDVVSGAGLRIRRMAKAADELPPTERVKRIAEIFSHFRNPDKETVLTPWRVVNLHLSNMVGGYCFLNEQFDSQEVLEEPRLVDQGQVTEDIFLNPEARILEMNSKSGLYPLYMAYSLYAMKLPGPEDKLPLEQPHYISMIMPARWYAGGIGLNDFRNEMLNDPHLIRLTDFVNSKDCFSTVDIAGGICYFLWDRDKEEVCEVTNVSGLERHTMRRNLNEFGEIFIRSNESLSIIHKVLSRSEHFLTDRVQPIDAFGFPSAARGEKEPFDGCISLIHSQGTGYIKRSDVKKNAELIDKYKATISILVPCNGEVGIDPSKGYKAITTPRIEVPGEVNTFSYLVLGAFDTEAEIKNYKQYLMCKFTRFMLRLTYSSMHIARANFVFVPDQDFTEEWTDEKLYKKYELTEDEIAFIESTIRVME